MSTEPKGMFRVLFAGRDCDGDPIKVWQSWVVADSVTDARRIAFEYMTAAIGAEVADGLWVDTIECVAREIKSPDRAKAEKIVATLKGNGAQVAQAGHSGLEH